ncbi:alpha/beta hydrolase, partial [Streptomyces sparsogenes]
MLERDFTVGEVPGVLWSPMSGAPRGLGRRAGLTRAVVAAARAPRAGPPGPARAARPTAGEGAEPAAEPLAPESAAA